MRNFDFVKRIENEFIDKEERLYLKLPKRSTQNSAGYDFFNPEDIVCLPHQITLIKTGIKAQFPEDETLLLFNRSSNPSKKSLILLNGVGVVDSDYYNNPDNEGEMGFAFYNMSDEPVEIKAGEKLGQGIFVKYLMTDNDETNGQRTGGWGSTGV